MRKSIEQKSKPVSLALLRPLLTKGNPRAEVLPSAALSRVLIIKPEKLGDMVVILPMIDALRTVAPKTVVDLIAAPSGVAVVQDDPRFDTIELYRKNPLDDLKMIRRVRRYRYDVTIDMIDDDSTTGLLLSQFCSGSALRFGANKNRLAEYYDFHTDFHADPLVHSIDRALELLTFFGLKRDTLSGFAAPFLPRSARDRAGEYLKQQELSSYIAVNVSAGKRSRIWAEEKYIALIKNIQHDKPTVGVIVITDPSDRDRGETIVARLGHRAKHIPSGWSILDIAALLRQMTAVISPDTSIVHLARAFEVPVIGLYPHPEWVVKRWQPYGQEVGIVRSSDEGDIADISPDEVLAAFREVMAREKVIDQ